MGGGQTLYRLVVVLVLIRTRN